MGQTDSLGRDSRKWGSLECMFRGSVAMPSIDHVAFKKFLSLAPHCAGAPANIGAFGHAQTVHVEDDMNELMEEDIWGDETSTYSEDIVLSSSSTPDNRVECDDDRSAIRTTSSFTSQHFLTSKSMCSIVDKPSSASGLDLVDGSFVSSPMPRSAPVEVPFWSNLYGRQECRGRGVDVDDDEEMLPPHELLAKQNARSQLAFSVVEGAGRTLKGRDARKVRDAVWMQTGFPG